MSPNKGPDYTGEHQHILPTMREAGVIDSASVSFSLATLEMDDYSYAVFGDVNFDQIVGGEEGLYTFSNFQNDL